MSDVASIHAEGAGTIPENTGTPEGAELDTAAADHFASRRDAGVDDFGGGAPGDEFGIEGLESLPADEQDRVRRSVAGKNNELVAERKRLERERTQMEAARLAYENAMRQQPAAEEPTVQEKPVFQEGEDPTAFMERLTDWKLNQKLNELGLNETQQTVDSLKRGKPVPACGRDIPQRLPEVRRRAAVLTGARAEARPEARQSVRRDRSDGLSSGPGEARELLPEPIAVSTTAGSEARPSTVPGRSTSDPARRREPGGDRRRDPQGHLHVRCLPEGQESGRRHFRARPVPVSRKRRPRLSKHRSLSLGRLHELRRKVHASDYWRSVQF